MRTGPIRENPKGTLGRHGEDLAARFLKKKGFSILARNVRSRYGEIDIIALDRGQTVFVEVRSLGASRWHLPEETIGAKKQQRLSRAALAYLQQHGLEDRPARFDVIAVEAEGVKAVIRHIPNAFEIWED
jgi:putative endonuclease